MALFTACKKESIKPIVTVPPDPYKHSHLIEIAYDNGILIKYSYNTDNQVAKVDYFNKSGAILNSRTFTYLNGKLVQVVFSNTTSTKNVTDYKYQGNTDLIESTITTATDYQNSTNPVVTPTNSEEYSYLDGKIFKAISKDSQNTPLSIRTSTYSVIGENPFVTSVYTPQAVNGQSAKPEFNYKTEYYKDVLDPVFYFLGNSTSESKLLLKNVAYSASYGLTQAYELDDMGRIKTVTAVTLNSSTNPAMQTTVKATYTYESY